MTLPCDSLPLQGATQKDLLTLINHDMLFEGLYMYDILVKEVWRPTFGDVPWQIAFVLSRFHSKHRFTLGLRPKRCSFVGDLKMFRDKSRCRLALRNSMEPLPLIKVERRLPLGTPLLLCGECMG